MLLEINNLNFSYQTDKALFQNLNFEAEAGNIVVVAGESGCGKSTLLGLIYGLMDWKSGEIIFDGRKLMGPKGNLVPGEADMKLVAQNYDLMPYASVYDNVGKYISNINLNAKKEKVEELLDIVGLLDYAKVLPKNLSGGQQQRVAIARALSVIPKLLLLDEPFSNLDFSRKFELREKMFAYVKDKGMSLIISTHNLEEVMPWADKIVILQKGQILQTGSPQEIYSQPASDYVAGLLGEVNIFPDEERLQLGIMKRYYFPHQLIVVENGREVDVLESKFAGAYFRTKVLINQKKIILYTKEKQEGKIKIQFCG